MVQDAEGEPVGTSHAPPKACQLYHRLATAEGQMLIRDVGPYPRK